MRILLADDSESIRASLNKLLGKALGHEIVAVSSGEELLIVLNTPGQHFDAVITDHHMGGQTGLQVLRIIRGSLHLKDIPVIVFSATPEIARAVQTAGGRFVDKTNVGNLTQAITEIKEKLPKK